ncbi:MAG: hypothetical protein ACIALR_10120 [Blastopirellula sp. JB062]
MGFSGDVLFLRRNQGFFGHVEMFFGFGTQNANASKQQRKVEAVAIARQRSGGSTIVRKRLIRLGIVEAWSASPLTRQEASVSCEPANASLFVSVFETIQQRGSTSSTKA